MKFKSYLIVLFSVLIIQAKAQTGGSTSTPTTAPSGAGAAGDGPKTTIDPTKSGGVMTPEKTFDDLNPKGSDAFKNPDYENTSVIERIDELRKAGLQEDEIQRYLNYQYGNKVSVKDVFKLKRDLSEEEAKKQQIKALQGLPDYFGKNANVNTEVYGGSIFGQKSLIFTPVENPVPPDDYKIGPGDNLEVTIWGQAEYQNTFTVDKDGSIFPSGIGKIFLKGITFKNAKSLLKDKFQQQVPSGSIIEISMGHVRTVRVNIVGEVNQPGAYSISSLNTAFNALYLAGGPNKLGSLREIYVRRNGKTIDTLDVYRYLQSADNQEDIYLENNDVLYVPVYKKQVDIAGEIKRPLIYQLKANENLADLLLLSGGIKFNARLANIQIFRTESEKVRIIDLNAYDIISNTKSFELLDGDRVFIRSINDEITNKAQIIGEVAYPGIYELKKGEKVADLIAKAGGLKGEAYLKRAYVIRITKDFKLQYIPINLDSIAIKDKINEANNIEINQFDALKIYSISNFQDIPYVTVHGLVRSPGNYILSGKRTLKDLLYISGGMKGEAEYNMVEIASIVSIEDAKRRNIPIKTVIRQYSLDPILEEDTIADKIILSPYDQIFVRKNPDFSYQKNVSITGQVKYPGLYSKKDDKERISSLIKRSGGILPSANVKGATFIRKTAGNVILIDLASAIKKPGSKFDIILNEGDELNIPELNEVIKINGDVQVPISVFFDKENTDFLYYIDLAGGFGDKPWRRKCTVTYANGIVKRAHSILGFVIYPKVEYGSSLNIPSKPERRLFGNIGRFPVEIMQSLLLMIGTINASFIIYNNFKTIK